MSQEALVGTILIREWPQFLDITSEPYSGNWSMVTACDGFALDRKIRAAGWNFFFIASQVKVKFFGTPKANKIEHAIHRILGKTGQQHFNSLEITGIVAKRFMGLPYTIVSAHSRHLQQHCYLDGAEARRSSQRDAAWARG